MNNLFNVTNVHEFIDIIDKAFNDTQYGPLDKLSPINDITESKNNIIIRLEMPGTDKAKISVSVENNILKVTGIKEKPSEDGFKNLYSRCLYGTYEKEILLPKNVNIDSIKASYESGILIVVIPKSKQTDRTSIKIK